MKLTEPQFEDLRATYAASMPGFKPRLNVYVCDVCDHLLITIDREPGVTPFMMPCFGDGHFARRPEDLSPRKIRRLTPAARREQSITVRMPDGRAISARSTMYRVPKMFRPDMATIEFYRPTFAEYEQMKDGPLADHVSKGGLLWRKIGSSEGELNQLEGTY